MSRITNLNTIRIKYFSSWRGYWYESKKKYYYSLFYKDFQIYKYLRGIFYKLKLISDDFNLNSLNHNTYYIKTNLFFYKFKIKKFILNFFFDSEILIYNLFFNLNMMKYKYLEDYKYSSLLNVHPSFFIYNIMDYGIFDKNMNLTNIFCILKNIPILSKIVNINININNNLNISSTKKKLSFFSFIKDIDVKLAENDLILNHFQSFDFIKDKYLFYKYYSKYKKYYTLWQDFFAKKLNKKKLWFKGHNLIYRRAYKIFPIRRLYRNEEEKAFFFFFRNFLNYIKYMDYIVRKKTNRKSINTSGMKIKRNLSLYNIFKLWFIFKKRKPFKRRNKVGLSNFYLLEDFILRKQNHMYFMYNLLYFLLFYIRESKHVLFHVVIHLIDYLIKKNMIFTTLKGLNIFNSVSNELSINNRMHNAIISNWKKVMKLKNKKYISLLQKDEEDDGYYNIFISFFLYYLIFNIEYSIFLFSGNNCIFYPSFFFYKMHPPIISSKLIGDTILFDLEQNRKISKIFKKIQSMRYKENIRRRSSISRLLKRLLIRDLVRPYGKKNIPFLHYLNERVEMLFNRCVRAYINLLKFQILSKRFPIVGIRIECNGPSKRGKMAQLIAYHNIIKDYKFYGKMPYNTIMADVDYYQTYARTKRGSIGIKVWIFFHTRSFNRKKKIISFI